MVQVYAMNIAKLPDPMACSQIMEGLEQSRKEKIMRCKKVDTRRQSLGAGLLLKHVLEIYGIENPKVELGPHGKPGIEGLYYNLSHSKEMVLCAVSEKPVGCDVEKIGDAPKKVADRFLCDSERAYLDELSGDAWEKTFYRLWTMKESYMKMTGEGLSLPLKSFEMKIGDMVQVYREGELQDCHIREYEVPGYAVTVCAMGDSFSENLNIVMTK